MDRSKHLILIKGEDKTGNIEFCKYNPSTHKYDVKFAGGRAYQYGYLSVEWIKNPEMINPNTVQIKHENKDLYDIRVISVFYTANTAYWYFRFNDGYEATYNKNSLKITYSCLTEEKAKNCIEYLRQLAAINELKSDNGEVLLNKQYEKLP